MVNLPLSKRVELKIIRLISEGHLKVGDRLPPERELAEAMNVSRHTLRQAIKALENSGILSSKPGSGTFITENRIDDGNGQPEQAMFAEMPKMTDIFQFRWALEPAIAATCVSNANMADLRLIKKNLDLQGRVIEQGDMEAWAQADLDYHLLLARASGNSLFASVMENLSHCIAICVDHSHLNPARVNLYYQGHLSVYEAVLDRNPAQAAFHMQEHLRLLPWQENLRVSSVADFCPAG